MTMRVHEIHPAIAHFPVALLPTAVACDVFGAVSGDVHLMETGRRLMPLAALGMAATGLAGFVAQGAVKTGEDSHDLLITHRNLNVGLLAVTTVLAALRTRRERPSPAYLAAGLAASALVTYTGYLGGRMVYEHGVGVAAAEGFDPARAPEIHGNNLAEVASASTENTVHALKHAARHIAEGKIAPTLRD